MPIPVSQTNGAGVHISKQHNAELVSEGPFERAARLRAEREAAEAAGVAVNPQVPTTMPSQTHPVPTQSAPEKIQGDAIIDVKGLNFSYPGLGGLEMGSWLTNTTN
eukprot:1155240-Pelagomonas_calceolata.AAC.6